MKIIRQKEFGLSNGFKAIGGLATLGAIVGGTVGNKIDKAKASRPVTEEEITDYRKYLNDGSKFYEDLSKKVQDRKLAKLSDLSKNDLDRLREGVYESGDLDVLNNAEEYFNKKLTDDDRTKLSKELRKISSSYQNSSRKTDNEIRDRISKTKSLLNNSHKARNIGSAIGTGIGLLGGAALLKTTRK